MGYMGFGMRKEVYSRKPKKPFIKLRKLYESEISKEKKQKINTESRFTKEEVEIVKSRIRRKIKKENIRDRILYISIVLILFSLLFFI